MVIKREIKHANGAIATIGERLESLRKPVLRTPNLEEEYYLGCVTGCVCTTCGAHLDLVHLEYNLPKPE